MELDREKLLEALRGKNVKVDDTINRFVGNTALFIKFIVSFALEDRMPAIYEAYESGDNDKLIMTVHKLKGVAGNLGIMEIYETAEKAIAILRSGSRDGVYDLLKRLEVLCADISETVKSNIPEGFDPDRDIEV